jgi:hypothetical protein
VEEAEGTTHGGTVPCSEFSHARADDGRHGGAKALVAMAELFVFLTDTNTKCRIDHADVPYKSYMEKRSDVCNDEEAQSTWRASSKLRKYVAL